MKKRAKDALEKALEPFFEELPERLQGWKVAILQLEARAVSDLAKSVLEGEISGDNPKFLERLLILVRIGNLVLDELEQ